MGVARVPDPLLESLAAVEHPDKTVHATLDLLDLPAMARPGAAGLGGRFLGRLREMEAIAVVLRAFEDEGVPADESGTNPVEQAEMLLLELAVADHDVFTRKAPKAVKEAAADPSKKGAAAAIAAGLEVLNEGKALRSRHWNEIEDAAFRDLAPLTLKPAVWVVNVAEDDPQAEDVAAAVAAVVPPGDTRGGAVGAHRGGGGPPRPRGAGGDAGGVRPRRRRPGPGGAGHLRRPAPPDLLHLRAQGGPRPHRAPRRPRPGGGRQDPHRHGARLHPGRDRSDRRSGSGGRLGCRPGRRGRAGWRDATT